MPIPYLLSFPREILEIMGTGSGASNENLPRSKAPLAVPPSGRAGFARATV
jgi:hypothetical protein